MTNVTQFPRRRRRALSNGAALEWLRARGTVETASYAALGDTWGWERSRAAKAVKAWTKAGEIDVAETGTGKSRRVVVSTQDGRRETEAGNERENSAAESFESRAAFTRESPARVYTQRAEIAGEERGNVVSIRRAAEAAGKVAQMIDAPAGQQRHPEVSTVKAAPVAGQAPPVAPVTEESRETPDPATISFELCDRPADPPARPATHTATPESDAAVQPDRRHRSLSFADGLAYAVAVALAAVTASFSVRGMIVLFPALPMSIVALAVACEAAKLVGIGWLAANWRATSWAFRIVLAALITTMAGINAVGVYSQLVAAHVGKVALNAGANNMRAASVDARLETAGAKVADLDRQIAAIDAVIAGAAARGKANTALAAMDSQKNARAALAAQRESAAAAVANLKIERAGAGERAKIDAVEAAPVVYVGQMLGMGDDPEAAIRWLILAMTLCADPMALALTACVSARRRGAPRRL